MIYLCSDLFFKIIFFNLDIVCVKNTLDEFGIKNDLFKKIEDTGKDIAVVRSIFVAQKIAVEAEILNLSVFAEFRTDR